MACQAVVMSRGGNNVLLLAVWTHFHIIDKIDKLDTRFFSSRKRGFGEMGL